MKIKQILSIVILTMFFQTSFAQLRVVPSGNVGIGTNTPWYKLHVAGRGYFRVGNNVITIFPDNPGVEIGSSTDEINFWYSNTGFNRLYATNLYRSSDSTLKTNIKAFNSGITTIMKLNTYSYFMKEDKDNLVLEYGFLSQEVEKVLPGITSRSKDVLMIDYDQITPILVEAVKEQQKQIEILQKIVFSQENELINIKSNSNTQELDKKNNEFGDNVSILYDNIPNPFNTETEIRFFIPTNTKFAKIIVYNLQGKEMKSYNITEKGNGKVIINSSELYAGMFVYTLIVDNQIIDTKRMVLTNN